MGDLSRTLARVLVVAAATSAPLCCLGAEPVESLLGSWSGAGKIVLQQGTESIKCNAYNTGTGKELRLVVRCASTSYKVEVRSRLARSGSDLAGEWEERTYNASGQASGTIGDGRISLAISGGGFKGDMSLTVQGNRLSIAVTTTGIDMKSLTMSLARL